MGWARVPARRRFLYSAPVSTPAADDSPGRRWLLLTGRLLRSNERLLLLPILAAAVDAALSLPLLASLDDRLPSLLAFTREVLEQARLADVLDDPSAAGARTLVVLGGYVAASALVGGILDAVFLRSLRSDRPPAGEPLMRRPEPALVRRLVGWQLGLSIVLLGALMLLPRGVWLLAQIAIELPTLFVEYAVVFEGLSVGAAVARSARFVRGALGRSILAWFAILFAQLALYDLLYGGLRGADGVWAPYVVAVVLALGLMRYAVDCVLVALFADRAPLPAASVAAVPAGPG